MEKESKQLLQKKAIIDMEMLKTPTVHLPIKTLLPELRFKKNTTVNVTGLKAIKD